MEIIARYPSDIPQAYARYYALLADTFAALMPAANEQTILEAGCGRGQLTLPLLARLPKKTHMICVDSSKGPYAGWLQELSSKISRFGLEARVRLISGDVRKMKVTTGSVDCIVSNELICDLMTRDSLNKALREFHRVLKPGGFTIHGEWSSWEDRISNKLTARHSPAWDPDQLFAILGQNGFHHIKAHYFDTTIRFDYRAALFELRSWTARRSAEKRILTGHTSLSLPCEHIITARK